MFYESFILQFKIYSMETDKKVKEIIFCFPNILLPVLLYAMHITYINTVRIVCIFTLSSLENNTL